MKKKTTNNYLKIIDQISNARKKNNTNWMKILRLSFKLAPRDAKKILKDINIQDKKISKLVEKISRK